MSISEWKEVKLGEVCTLGDGAHTKVKRLDRGILYLSSKNIQNGKLNLDDVSYISEDDYTKLFSLSRSSVRNLQDGDVLIGIIGTIGNAYVYRINDRFGISSSVAIIRPNPQELKSGFLYYVLSSNYFQKILASVKGGSVQGYTNLPLLRSLPITIPPIHEQKAITSTLSCLDDKIELNNCINKNLEEIAQAIFKSWFVDFEPFQDGEFEDSELGRIPKGWRVGTIGDLISDTLGGDWGKEVPQGNYSQEVICIRGADIPEIATGKKGKPPTRYILEKNLEKKRLSEAQIIIEISGGSPTQSTGRTALITHQLVNFAGKPMVCTNFCRALSMKKEYYATFVYSILHYLYNKDIFFLFENGTTGIKNLDTNNLFSKYLIVLPDDETMIRYKEIFDTIINSIYQNGDEIDKLSTTRDTLLPKLMSGEIRVPIEEVQ